MLFHQGMFPGQVARSRRPEVVAMYTHVLANSLNVIHHIDR